MFYDRFVKLCNEKGLYPSRVGEAIGLNSSSVTGLKRGSIPTDATLQKLCDYLNVDISYFKEKEPTDDVMEMARKLRDREEIKVMFDIVSKQPKETVEKMIQIIEVLTK